MYIYLEFPLTPVKRQEREIELLDKNSWSSFNQFALKMVRHESNLKCLNSIIIPLDLRMEKIRRLLDFLTAYVHFEQKEINDTFDEELKKLTNKSETMGITEQILDIANQDGIREGARGERKASIERISKNLLKEGLDINLIHKATSMPISKLEKLKKELQAK